MLRRFNPRITTKERNLIKGAINRVFARSKLRNDIVASAIIPDHKNPNRTKVKVWVKCNNCKDPEARSYIDVDHIIPKVPLDSSFDDMTFDEYIDRTWCEIENLQPLCPKCHNIKSKEENKKRREYKKTKRVLKEDL